MSPMPSSPSRAHVLRMSATLDVATDLLENAHDADAFVFALQTTGLIWSDLRWSLSRSQLPDRLYDFAMSVVSRARHRVTDQEIESLVRLNRFVSRELLSAPRLRDGGEVETVWREWLNGGRQAAAMVN